MKNNKSNRVICVNKVAQYQRIKFVEANRSSKKMITELVDIIPNSQKVQDILERVMELNDNPIIFLGFEDHIIGYDPISHSLIYDALGVVNQIAEERYNDDRENYPNECMDWEDYYDSAEELVIKGELTKVSLITNHNEAGTDESDTQSEPILMTY
ncbi:hypothetical protein [Aquirufa aurantiipilula]|uniref:Uncharacterized protein n=1 Tax=Aquirufa aurantiipilula TaxID=2696561 RepID=A0ABT6BML6_9BACT|nr:hypothetical protein [Aquirufa aurantiipilula]MDF5691609.1 hypothetical protein [Aquirufa aurantiipilula]